MSLKKNFLILSFISEHCIHCYFIFLAASLCLQDLNSLIRVQTHALISESLESQPLDRQAIPYTSSFDYCLFSTPFPIFSYNHMYPYI